MEPNERSKPNRPKRYSPTFKAQVLAESGLPGALIKEVALKHGIATSSLHKWRLAANSSLLAQDALVPTKAVGRFVRIPVQSQGVGEPSGIRIEVPHKSGTVCIHWPLHDSGNCASWLHQWLT
jgi:transposase